MELQKKLEELGTAFEEFKKVNDARLKEIAEKGVASADKEQKLAKVEEHITSLEKQVEELNAAIARTKAGGQDPQAETKEQKNSREYKEALIGYIRKGREIPAELKAMSVDSDEDGGFLVTPEMSSEIVKTVFESSPVRQLASVQTISTDSLEMLYDEDEVGSGWVGETQARSESTTPQLKKLSFPVHELFSFPKATQKLLDDAALNVESWLSGKVSEKFARDEATAFISGNGVLKPKGILNYGSGTTFGLIQRGETAANNALDGNDFIGVQSLLKEAYQGNASWLINRLFVGLIRKLKDTTSGQYIWQPGLTAGQPNQLLGKPVYFATDLLASITANTDALIYGDIKAGYQIVDRIGIRVLRDPFTAKPYVGFYTTKRVGGGVKNFEAIKVLKIKA